MEDPGCFGGSHAGPGSSGKPLGGSRTVSGASRGRVLRQFVVSPWRPMIIKEGNVPSDDVLSEAPCRCERSDRAVGSPDFGTRRRGATTAGHGGSAHPEPRFGRERETHARATAVQRDRAKAVCCDGATRV